LLDELREDAQADVFELDGRAFGFEAEVAVGGVAVRSARDFLTVDPKADFAVDGADVVVVPLVDAFGEAFGGKTAFAIRGDGWKGRHFSGASGEDIAMGGEPIGGCSFAFFPVGFVAEVEDLHFNAIGKAPFSGGELFNGSGAGPGEDPGVACAFGVHPFADEFEVFDGLF
jgi:hypothetical protein